MGIEKDIGNHYGERVALPKLIERLIKSAPEEGQLGLLVAGCYTGYSRVTVFDIGPGENIHDAVEQSMAELEGLQEEHDLHCTSTPHELEILAYPFSSAMRKDPAGEAKKMANELNRKTSFFFS